MLSAAPSHPVIIGPAPAFRWNPGDDLVGVLNVAGLAVDAVGGVQADALAVRRARVVQHFVHIRRAEILAWAPELFHAALIADVRIVDYQMRRLILFVLR